MTTVDIAQTLAMAGRVDDAEALLRRVPGNDPARARAAAALADLLMDGPRIAEAVALAQEALHLAAHDPTLLRLYRRTGLALHAQWLWEDARPWLERAATLEPWDPALPALLERSRLREDLAPSVFDAQQGRALRRYAPRESAQPIYVIDIVGTCNLRCPTCPVGNSELGSRPRGMMGPEMFREIIRKIRAESPAPRPQVNLFNWGEPLLHPQLPDFIRLLREAGMASHLSTNLNIRRGLDAIVAAAPDDLKISLSGFTPETYARTHAGGDLALVKANMVALRQALDRSQARTHVWVSHHLYRSNIGQSAAVQAFCQELRFAYNPIQAFYMPLERLAGLVEGKANPRDAGVVADLLVPPQENLRSIARQRSGAYDCELRFNQTVINHDGSVALCCAVYDQGNMLGVGFLDEPHAALEARKYDHPFCATCMQAGLHYTRSELRPEQAMRHAAAPANPIA